MSDRPDTPSLQVQLLGGFRIAAEGRALGASDLRLRAAQQMIKLLALAPGLQLHREQVLAALWPDQEPQAAANGLNQALFVARRALAPDASRRSQWLTLREQIVRLGDPALVWVDAAAFSAQAERASQRRDLTAGLAALALYTGDLLPEDPYDSWIDARRAALRQRYRALLLDLAAWSEGEAPAAQVRAALQQALAGDPTDEELHRAAMRLAARAGDRPAALRQYAQLAQALRHDLQLEPDPLSEQLYQEIRAGRLGPSAAEPPRAPAAPGDLWPARAGAHIPAPLTSFVGRTRELAELRALLGSSRLLTISGPGGSGKTRLSLEAARAAAPAYPDGAWAVELAGLSDPALLAAVVLAGLGLRERQGMTAEELLTAELQGRSLLLILDNCEHLVDACARLAELLLQRCPGLRILATSREPLRIGGEIVWLIPALSLPDPRQPPPDRAALAQYEAPQLFVDRARAARASFALRDDEIPALVELCARLDGMPLAIELAAAQVRTLSLAQIAARLDDRFQLLRGGSRTALTRQQTLRAAIDWSYDLLDAGERALFRRLAVFAGGWTLDAAEAVCADPELPAAAVLLLLSRLVDKSLVGARDEGEARRYDLLETIRQYARERLEESGEAIALGDRHQRWCLDLAAAGEVELTGPDQVVWLARLAAEIDNLRAALHWAASEAAGTIPWLQLAYRLYWFWYLNSAVGEGRAVFERGLAHTAASEPSWARGVALLGSGAMALYQGELRTARERLEASLPILRAGDDAFSRALAPFMAGTVAVNQGDYPAAQALLEECLPRFEALGHHQGVATALLHLGDVALGRGQPGEAERLYRRCLAIHRAETGSTWGLAQALNNLGEVARYRAETAAARDLYTQALAHFAPLATRADVARTGHNLAALALSEGDLPAAEAGFRASLALFRAWGNCRGIVECLSGLAQVTLARAGADADRETAAALLGYAEGYFATAGAAMWPPDRLALTAARGALAAPRLSARWARGRELTLDQAIALAEGRAGLGED